MEATIYKPSIYKGPTIYKGGGGDVSIIDSIPNNDSSKEGSKAVLDIEVKYYTDDGNIIPVQTDGSNCFGSTADIWKVFDGSTGTSVTGTYTKEFGFDFGEGNEKKINSVSVMPRYYSGNCPTALFIVKGSKDKRNWDYLAFCPLLYFCSGSYNNVKFKNDELYRFYSIVCHCGQNTTIEISEIHMNDAEGELVPNFPQLFVKSLGVWNLASYPTAFDCDAIEAIYRKTGVNTNIDGQVFGYFSSNLYAEIEGIIDPALFNTGYCAFIGWSNNWNPPLQVKFDSTWSGSVEYITIGVDNSANYGPTLSIEKSIFLQKRTFKIILDTDKWDLYFDDTLYGSQTISNYTYIASQYISSVLYILGGTYNSGLSCQLGLKRFLLVDKDDNHLVFDFVAAKRSEDYSIGLFEKRLCKYFGFGPTVVGEIT